MDHLFGQTYLASDLYGKGTPRATYGELEERTHLVAVVEHSPVDEPCMILGVGLEILIVRRDHAEAPRIIEAVEEGLCDCSADGRLSASAELIDEKQAP